MMIQLARLTAVLASIMIFGTINAYNRENEVGNAVKKIEDVKSSTFSKRSLNSNIFQAAQESTTNHDTAPTHEKMSNKDIDEEIIATESSAVASSVSILLDSSPTPKPTKMKKKKSKSAKATSQPTNAPTNAADPNVYVVYTSDADFDNGSSINVNHNAVQDELQLDSTSEPFDFIWIACSGRGTVVKVNTLTGEIKGEYRSAPDNLYGNPSRTTVDQDGSVWLSNRNDIGPNGGGTIVHVGLLENNQCEDRNGDGIIQTSTGLTDIKSWASGDGGTRGVQTADDECIVHYVEVSSSGTRHVSIDVDNNVWVGGYYLPNFDKVKGGRYDYVDAQGKKSGDILATFPSVGFGGYGGLIDSQGILWSAGLDDLLRWDTSGSLTPGQNGDPSTGLSIGPLASGYNWAGQSGNTYYYGVCIDSQGNVWATDWSFSGSINKFAPDGTHLGTFFHGSTVSQGCVVGLNDDVWVAHSGSSTSVGHIANNGSPIGVVSLSPFGSGPTGVAVDRMGKIWAANINTSNLSRIDPSLNTGIGAVDMTVDLGDGCSPYNYGDMTGSTNTAPPNTGSWTVKYDHGTELAAWGRIQWTEVTPGDSSLTVNVKSNEGDPWMSAQNDEDLSNLTGQYLYVQVSFSRATTGESPSLKDLTLVFPGTAGDSPTSNPTSMPTSKASKSTRKPTNQPTSKPDFVGGGAM
jgi:sugar lactone lactonase YvrE